MNFATGYAFNTKHIFRNFDYKKIKSVKSHYVNKEGRKRRRDHMVISVFIYAVKLILIDIFTNNNTFNLPLVSGKTAKIKMRAVRDEDFKNARRNGKFLDVDFIRSDYTGYVPTFEYQSSKVIINKNIYVSKWLQDICTKRTNEGKTYF